MIRVVSGSNFWPLRNGVIGMIPIRSACHSTKRERQSRFRQLRADNGPNGCAPITAPMADSIRVKFIPGGSMEYEAVVVKLSSSEALRVLHELERFNPLTHRRGNTRSGGRGRPYSETHSRDQSDGNGKQCGLAHLNPPIQSARLQQAV